MLGKSVTSVVILNQKHLTGNSMVGFRVRPGIFIIITPIQFALSLVIKSARRVIPISSECNLH